MITVSQLLVDVGANTDPLEQGMDSVKSAIGAAGNVFESMLGGLGDFGGAVAKVGLAGFGVLSGAIGGFLMMGNEAEQSQSALEAAIAQTGATTHITAQHAEDLATALMGVTRYDDQAVQGAEQIISRYTNIGAAGGVFDQVTKMSLNLSTAMGTGLEPTTKSLAKAINEPAQAFGYLHKVGVDFDAQEKANIKTMVAHGNVIGAQQIELNKLAAVYGNAAQAAGKTFGGEVDIAKNKLSNMGETIGQAMLPAVTGLIDKMQPLIDGIGSQLPGAIDTAGRFFNDDILPVLHTVGDAFSSLTGSGKPLELMQMGLSRLGTEAGGPLSTLGGVITGLTSNLKPFVNDVAQLAIFFIGWGNVIDQQLLPPMEKIGGVIGATIVPLLQDLGKAFDSLDLSGDSGDLDGLYNIVKGLASVLTGFSTVLGSLVMPLLKDLFTWLGTDILPVVRNVANAVLNTLGPALQGIGQRLQQAEPFFKQLESAIKNLLPVVTVVFGVVAAMFVFGLAVVSGVVNGIIEAIGGLIQVITGIVQVVSGVWEIIQGVFTGNGDKIMHGLGTLGQGILNIFGGLFSAIGGLLHGFVTGFLGFLDNLTGGALSRFGGLVGGIFSWLGSMVHIGLTMAGSFVGNILGALASLPGKAWDAFTGLITAVGNLEISIVQGAAHLIGSFIDTIVNGITGATTRFGSALHDMVSYAVHHIPVVGSLIPAFAGGGTAPGGPILVGEVEPEIIVPPAGSQVYNQRQIRQASGGQNGGNEGPYTFIFQIDSRTMARQVFKHLPREVRIKTGVTI